MLYLNPPFLTVKGLSVFGDHADPLQWYYLPMQPRVATRVDATGATMPAFSLVRFKSADGATGGLLDLDVDLRVDDGLLAEAAAEIQAAARLSGEPRLAPVPIEDGTVSLTVLGQVDGAAPDPATGEPPFRVTIVHAAKPSLYGDNRAAFSAVLDEKAAVLLDRTLDGELVPIAVVYALDFSALRPAYAVKLSIDWNRVQERLDKTYGGNQIFYSTQISETVDKLVEDRAIVLDVTTLVVEGPDTKSVIASRDRAVAAVQDMITDAFFTATIDPKRESPDGWDKAAAFHERFDRSVATAGGLLPSFSYRNEHHTRIDAKRLDVTMNERVTVRRSIYPQGHLTGVADVIAASGRPRTDFVRSVDLDDPWFQRRRVRVFTPPEFGVGHVSSVEARLSYAGQVHTTLLVPGALEQTLDWASVLDGDRMLAPVEASAVLTMTSIEDIDRPARLTGPATTVDGETWQVLTDDVFRVRTIPVRAEGVPWGRWSKIEVTLRYADPDHGIAQSSTLELVEGSPAWDYKLFTLTGSSAAFDYRVRYVGLGGPDLVRDWVRTDEEEVRLRDPIPDKRSIAVIPNVAWAQVNRVLVDLRYDDPAHDVAQEQSFEFSQAQADTQNFVLDLRDPLRRRVWWQATLLHVDGSTTQLGPSYTTDTRLLVTPGVLRRQVVFVTADLSDAAAKGVRDVAVTVMRDGSDTPIADLTFTPGGLPQEFLFDHAGDTDVAYRYQVATHLNNGMDRTADWVTTSAVDLAVTTD